MFSAGTFRPSRSTALALAASCFVAVLFFLLNLSTLDVFALKPAKPAEPVEGADSIDVSLGKHGLDHTHLLSAPSLSRKPPAKAGSDVADRTFSLKEFFLKQMHRPSVPPDARYYRRYGAFIWQLLGEPRWKHHLGENLCIIDLDNRTLDGPNQIFGPEYMTWTDPARVDGLSLGILNHWLYAQVHGYKYYYVKVDAYEDRRTNWKKPSIISKILKQHEVCLYIDTDAIFNHLDLPFEWLLNYWQLDPSQTSLALAVDPPLEFNKDMWGRYHLNTGFIVAQNKNTTFDILDAWDKCPNEGEPYPQCVEFRHNEPGRPTDQAGFGSYVRNDFWNEIKELPCTEANGFPESETVCRGVFVQHLWTSKQDHLKVEVGKQLPGPFLQTFHKHFKDDFHNFYRTEPELTGNAP